LVPVNLDTEAIGYGYRPSTTYFALIMLHNLAYFAPILLQLLSYFAPIMLQIAYL